MWQGWFCNFRRVMATCIFWRGITCSFLGEKRDRAVFLQFTFYIRALYLTRISVTECRFGQTYNPTVSRPWVPSTNQGSATTRPRHTCPRHPRLAVAAGAAGGVGARATTRTAGGAVESQWQHLSRTPPCTKWHPSRLISCASASYHGVLKSYISLSEVSDRYIM